MKPANPGSQPPAALETVEISKLFGGVHAVERLSIAIERGKITSIVGPNGSGKSTLINLLSGMLPLDEGMVIIDGAGLRTLKAHETPGHGITRTFQQVRLFDQISVWDNVMVTLTSRGVFSALLERARPQRRAKARAILEDVAMWDKRNSLALDLSYGQRKLLEIGRALAMGVNIYLFDEPFAGLFPQLLEHVIDILKQMRADGRTIIFISHNMEIVRDLSDYTFVLDSGALLADGEVDEALSRPEVIEAYLGA